MDTAEPDSAETENSIPVSPQSPNEFGHEI